ncbi:MAG TPA: phosphatase PAP2 family protein [Tepidisphaeraceae bacterium]|nr:phosphatase PAP2 family protein [Tepidisphaeraceae bacterium]
MEINPLRFRILPPMWINVGLLAIFVIACGLDSSVRGWISMDEALYARNESRFWLVVKQGGEWWFAALVCLILTTLHPWRWRSIVVLTLGALTSGLLVWFLKWCVGRTRPRVIEKTPFSFEPFRDGFDGIMHQANLTFPSGHAAMAFSIATCLCLMVPRGAWLWLAFGALVAAERVAELAHYPSDVVAGAIAGIVCTRFSLWFCFVVSGRRPLLVHRH